MHPTTGLPLRVRLLRHFDIYLGRLSAYRPRVGDRVWYYPTAGHQAAVRHWHGQRHVWVQTIVTATDRFDRSVCLDGIGWVTRDLSRFVFIESGRLVPVPLKLHIDEQDAAEQRLFTLHHVKHGAVCTDKDQYGNCKGHPLAYIEQDGLASIIPPGDAPPVLTVPIDLLSALCSLYARGMATHAPTQDSRHVAGAAAEGGMIGEI